MVVESLDREDIPIYFSPFDLWKGKYNKYDNI